MPGTEASLWEQRIIEGVGLRITDTLPGYEGIDATNIAATKVLRI